jgi:hypothetical protein
MTMTRNEAGSDRPPSWLLLQLAPVRIHRHTDQRLCSSERIQRCADEQPTR